jgi:peptidyl-dipeptidase A
MKMFVSAIALAVAMPAVAQNAVATVAEADAFVAQVEKEYADFSLYGAQVAWVNSTYITEDTDALSARVGTQGTEMGVRFAKQAAVFAKVPGLSYDTKRKLDFLRAGLVLPAPSTDGAAAELNTIATRLNSSYGKGKGTLKGVETNGSDIEAAMGTNRNPAELAEMWTSWHTNVGKPMKADYARMVEIANQGARELGYADTGAMWRSGYDMEPDAFAALTDKLWGEVKPLYDALHCYTRGKLNAKYGDAVQKAMGPIRADLLGNMWAQEWGDIYDIVAPAGAGDIGYEIGDLLKAKGFVETDPKETDPAKRGKWEKEIFKIGEGFFSSLGFEALPKTFWERTQFIKPLDRDVICHASAWDIDSKDDLRVKMCTKINTGDFVTVHHELGHNYYQRAYKAKSFMYQNGANDGFHEAIGDTVALSITPQYLVQIGLLGADKVPSADKDVGLLLRQAMDKVAFLPFGLLVDKWRWQVFSGKITPASYNKGWTDLRLQYQGITPPSVREEANFDPGAKYHIPGNTPYTRYFLARLLQFQFYEAACKQAEWRGPLHRCSFYGNKDVGKRFNAMLEMGASKPWPDALQAFTGSREMSGKSMVAYFKPLMTWLGKQNAGKQCGW